MVCKRKSLHLFPFILNSEQPNVFSNVLLASWSIRLSEYCCSTNSTFENIFGCSGFKMNEKRYKLFLVHAIKTRYNIIAALDEKLGLQVDIYMV